MPGVIVGSPICLGLLPSPLHAHYEGDPLSLFSNISMQREFYKPQMPPEDGAWEPATSASSGNWNHGVYGEQANGPRSHAYRPYQNYNHAYSRQELNVHLKHQREHQPWYYRNRNSSNLRVCTEDEDQKVPYHQERRPHSRTVRTLVPVSCDPLYGRVKVQNHKNHDVSNNISDIEEFSAIRNAHSEGRSSSSISNKNSGEKDFCTNRKLYSGSENLSYSDPLYGRITKESHNNYDIGNRNNDTKEYSGSIKPYSDSRNQSSISDLKDFDAIRKPYCDSKNLPSGDPLYGRIYDKRHSNHDIPNNSNFVEYSASRKHDYESRSSISNRRYDVKEFGGSREHSESSLPISDRSYDVKEFDASRNLHSEEYNSSSSSDKGYEVKEFGANKKMLCDNKNLSSVCNNDKDMKADAMRRPNESKNSSISRHYDSNRKPYSESKNSPSISNKSNDLKHHDTHRTHSESKNFSYISTSKVDVKDDEANKAYSGRKSTFFSSSKGNTNSHLKDPDTNSKPYSERKSLSPKDHKNLETKDSDAFGGTCSERKHSPPIGEKDCDTVVHASETHRKSHSRSKSPPSSRKVSDTRCMKHRKRDHLRQAIRRRQLESGHNSKRKSQLSSEKGIEILEDEDDNLSKGESLPTLAYCTLNKGKLEEEGNISKSDVLLTSVDGKYSKSESPLSTRNGSGNRCRRLKIRKRLRQAIREKKARESKHKSKRKNLSSSEEVVILEDEDDNISKDESLPTPAYCILKNEKVEVEENISKSDLILTSADCNLGNDKVSENKQLDVEMVDVSVEDISSGSDIVSADSDDGGALKVSCETQSAPMDREGDVSLDEISSASITSDNDNLLSNQEAECAIEGLLFLSSDSEIDSENEDSAKCKPMRECVDSLQSNNGPEPVAHEVGTQNMKSESSIKIRDEGELLLNIIDSVTDITSDNQNCENECSDANVLNSTVVLFANELVTRGSFGTLDFWLCKSKAHLPFSIPPLYNKEGVSVLLPLQGVQDWLKKQMILLPTMFHPCLDRIFLMPNVIFSSVAVMKRIFKYFKKQKLGIAPVSCGPDALNATVFDCLNKCYSLNPLPAIKIEITVPEIKPSSGVTSTSVVQSVSKPEITVDMLGTILNDDKICEILEKLQNDLKVISNQTTDLNLLAMTSLPQNGNVCSVMNNEVVAVGTHELTDVTMVDDESVKASEVDVDMEGLTENIQADTVIQDLTESHKVCLDNQKLNESSQELMKSLQGNINIQEVIKSPEANIEIQKVREIPHDLIESSQAEINVQQLTEILQTVGVMENKTNCSPADRNIQKRTYSSQANHDMQRLLESSQANHDLQRLLESSQTNRDMQRLTENSQAHRVKQKLTESSQANRNMQRLLENSQAHGAIEKLTESSQVRDMKKLVNSFQVGTAIQKSTVKSQLDQCIQKLADGSPIDTDSQDLAVSSQVDHCNQKKTNSIQVNRDIQKAADSSQVDRDISKPPDRSQVEIRDPRTYNFQHPSLQPRLNTVQDTPISCDVLGSILKNMNTNLPPSNLPISPLNKMEYGQPNHTPSKASKSLMLKRSYVDDVVPSISEPIDLTMYMQSPDLKWNLHRISNLPEPKVPRRPSNLHGVLYQEPDFIPEPRRTYPLQSDNPSECDSPSEPTIVEFPTVEFKKAPILGSSLNQHAIPIGLPEIPQKENYRRHPIRDISLKPEAVVKSVNKLSLKKLNVRHSIPKPHQVIEAKLKAMAADTIEQERSPKIQECSTRPKHCSTGLTDSERIVKPRFPDLQSEKSESDYERNVKPRFLDFTRSNRISSVTNTSNNLKKRIGAMVPVDPLRLSSTSSFTKKNKSKYLIEPNMPIISPCPATMSSSVCSSPDNTSLRNKGIRKSSVDKGESSNGHPASTLSFQKAEMKEGNIVKTPGDSKSINKAFLTVRTVAPFLNPKVVLSKLDDKTTKKYTRLNDSSSSKPSDSKIENLVKKKKLKRKRKEKPIEAARLGETSSTIDTNPVSQLTEVGFALPTESQNFNERPSTSTTKDVTVLKTAISTADIADLTEVNSSKTSTPAANSRVTLSKKEWFQYSVKIVNTSSETFSLSAAINPNSYNDLVSDFPDSSNSNTSPNTPMLQRVKPIILIKNKSGYRTNSSAPQKRTKLDKDFSGINSRTAIKHTSTSFVKEPSRTYVTPTPLRTVEQMPSIPASSNQSTEAQHPIQCTTSPTTTTLLVPQSEFMDTSRILDNNNQEDAEDSELGLEIVNVCSLQGEPENTPEDVPLTTTNGEVQDFEEICCEPDIVVSPVNDTIQVVANDRIQNLLVQGNELLNNLNVTEPETPGVNRELVIDSNSADKLKSTESEVENATSHLLNKSIENAFRIYTDYLDLPEELRYTAQNHQRLLHVMQIITPALSVLENSGSDSSIVENIKLFMENVKESINNFENINLQHGSISLAQDTSHVLKQNAQYLTKQNGQLSGTATTSNPTTHTNLSIAAQSNVNRQYTNDVSIQLGDTLPLPSSSVNNLPVTTALTSSMQQSNPLQHVPAKAERTVSDCQFATNSQTTPHNTPVAPVIRNDSSLGLSLDNLIKDRVATLFQESNFGSTSSSSQGHDQNASTINTHIRPQPNSTQTKHITMEQPCTSNLNLEGPASMLPMADILEHLKKSAAVQGQKEGGAASSTNLARLPQQVPNLAVQSLSTQTITTPTYISQQVSAKVGGPPQRPTVLRHALLQNNSTTHSVPSQQAGAAVPATACSTSTTNSNSNSTEQVDNAQKVAALRELQQTVKQLPHQTRTWTQGNNLVNQTQQVQNQAAQNAELEQQHTAHWQAQLNRINMLKMRAQNGTAAAIQTFANAGVPPNPVSNQTLQVNPMLSRMLHNPSQNNQRFQVPQSLPQRHILPGQSPVYSSSSLGQSPHLRQAMATPRPSTVQQQPQNAISSQKSSELRFNASNPPNFPEIQRWVNENQPTARENERALIARNIYQRLGLTNTANQSVGQVPVRPSAALGKPPEHAPSGTVHHHHQQSPPAYRQHNPASQPPFRPPPSAALGKPPEHPPPAHQQHPLAQTGYRTQHPTHGMQQARFPAPTPSAMPPPRQPPSHPPSCATPNLLPLASHVQQQTGFQAAPRAQLPWHKPQAREELAPANHPVAQPPTSILCHNQCGRTAQFVCKGCLGAVYCGNQECQKEHWLKGHSNVCGIQFANKR